jgi:hypothetical protein
MSNNDNDDIQPQLGDHDNDVGAGAAGVMSGNVAGASSASGSLGIWTGGPLGPDAVTEAAATGEKNDDLDEPLEDERRETGDQGVSPAQREVEADELNG